MGIHDVKAMYVEKLLRDRVPHTSRFYRNVWDAANFGSYAQNGSLSSGSPV
jgi:hypothetical protein